MLENTATIRELRTDFRKVKRRMEQHGQVVITDRGQPAYTIRPLPRAKAQAAPLPDYYARLRKRQPAPLSPAATQQFWEEERAAELSRTHTPQLGTRALDVLHVACAVELKARSFLTFDERQRLLAAAVGLRTIQI